MICDNLKSNVLVYIKQVNPNEIFVKLPNSKIGVISKNFISDSYNKVLNNNAEKKKSLRNLFEVGQVIYAKIGKSQNGTIKLSITPSFIHKSIHCSDLKNGLILQGAIKDIPKKNKYYIIDLGIKNLNVKLSKRNALKNYNVGDYILCKIDEVSNTIYESTISVLDITNIKFPALTLKEIPKISTLVPGVLVEFNIEKIENDYIYGNLFNGSINAKAKNPHNKSYKINKSFNALILYTEKKVIELELEYEKLIEKLTKKVTDFNFKIFDDVLLKIDQINENGVTGVIEETNKIAFIPQLQLSNSIKSYKIDEKIACKVYKIFKNKKVELTNRFEYIQPNAKILSDLNNISIGEIYSGCISQEHDKFYVVEFFNQILGSISKSEYNNNNVYIGKIDEFQILDLKEGTKKNKRIFLKTPSIISNKYSNCNIGAFETCTVISHHDCGIEVSTINDETKGFIPTEYLCYDLKLAEILKKALRDGDQLECVRVNNNNLFSLRDILFYKNIPCDEFDSINEGDIVQGFINTVINEQEIDIFIPFKNFLYNSIILKIENKPFIDFYHGQPIFLKINEKDSSKIISYAFDLDSVWLKNYEFTTEYTKMLLKDNEYVKEKLTEIENKLTNYKIGDKIKGKIIEINFSEIKLDLGNGVQGILQTSENVNIGDKLTCYIFWIDYSMEIIHLTMQKINKSKKDNDESVGTTVKANILTITDKFIISQCEESGKLIYSSKYVHPNDFNYFLQFLENYKTYEFHCTEIFENFIIGIPKPKQTENSEVVDKKLKRKILTEYQSALPAKKNKLTENNDDIEMDDLTLTKTPAMNDFWNLTLKTIYNTNGNYSDHENDSDNEDNKNESIPKKKLTAEEKRELFKKEEARIREIETTLSNPNYEPTTIDDFERMTIANPNDSMIWIKYMAYHLQSVEIDRARNVAKTALKNISFREENEKFNIWLALLNLEIRYGINETFKECLGEALKVNDEYKVYSKCLSMLIVCKKLEEINEIISIMKKKFKSKPEMWIQLAESYFQLNENKKAINLLGRALMSIDEKKHVQTIVQFAILMNKFNEKDSAHTYIEQVLSSYPKRIDVWSLYIDMLIKSELIDLARQTLDRAVSQILPIKKMRPLFKKYIEFEKKYGNKNSIERITEMAESYLEKSIQNVSK